MHTEEYRSYAAASLDLSKEAPNVASKADPLFIAEAWLDLAGRTTQLVEHEADGAHRLVEQPLSRVAIRPLGLEWIG